MLSKKPNIILINCDDLGYGDLGCYGSKINKTPALDKMAEEGMKFDSFYMASPICSPSRGGMMTGCYPPRIGFGDFDGKKVLFPGQGMGLNTGEITIAKVLKDAGYATKLIGKWHCGDQKEFLPTNHGFDSYYGLPYSNDMGIQAKADGSSGCTSYPPLPLMQDDKVLQEQPDQSSLTERYVEQAIRFIRENKDNPFFLYFAHMHVHLPHYPPDRFLRHAQNGEYGAAVECIDWAAAVIFDELKEQGISNNTPVIFTSDNGSNRRKGGSNLPLRGGKGSTWEGGMRVPCIMHWPGTIKAGTKCNEIISAIDFYPAFAHIADAKVPDERIIEGLDILPLITGNQNNSPRNTYYYYLKNNLEAIRMGKWKLHVHKGEDAVDELYDLESDISESVNLYDKYPDIVQKLNKHLDLCRADLGDEITGIKGKNIRPIGRVKNPVALTQYDPDHPYIIAMYDKNDAG